MTTNDPNAGRQPAAATPPPVKTCGWTWYDGETYHHCPLPWPHAGFHARQDGTIPTRSELPR